MDLRYSLSLVILWSVQFYGVWCQTQKVLFNLKDPESNEVISEFQENVALVCYVMDIENAAITISNVVGQKIATNLGSGNCLEHTIPRLTEADNGNYTCNVSYFNGVKGKEETTVKSLLLNVESGNQQCFRNGTSNQAFGVGDMLKLSCYCTSTINCNWIRTVVGTQNGFSIPVYETVEFDDNKRIIRVIVGPVTSDQNEERYDCFYGSLAEERCSIGPTYASSNDFVLNVVDPLTILRECPRPVTAHPASQISEIFGTSQGTAQGTVIPTTKVTEAPAESGLFLYISIAGGVLLLLILVVILLIFITLKRNRKAKAKEHGGEESVEASSTSNDAYASDRDTMTDTNSKGVSSSSLNDNDFGGNRALPGYSDRNQMGDTSHYGVPNAVLVNIGENVEHAAVNPKGKMAEVSQYGVFNAVVVCAGDDEKEQEEGFYRGEVTEYGVPVAFRADGQSDYTDVNRPGENYDVEELPLRCS